MRAIKYAENTHDQTVIIQLKLTPSEFAKFNIQQFNLENLTKYANDHLSNEHIIAVVCDDFKIAPSTVMRMRESGRLLKTGDLVDVRRLCYYFMRKYSGASLKEIGSCFSQEHSNVLYHLACVDAWKDMDMNLVSTLQRIDSKIKNEIKIKAEDEQI